MSSQIKSHSKDSLEERIRNLKGLGEDASDEARLKNSDEQMSWHIHLSPTQKKVPSNGGTHSQSSL